MKKFKIGHFSDKTKGTGCTVILCPEETRASAHARGISPGTREYALLSPYRKMDGINALLLTGGSAFGLDAAAGVMRFLSERDIGYFTPYRKIPIVPAAVIFDLPVIDSHARMQELEIASRAPWVPVPGQRLGNGLVLNIL